MKHIAILGSTGSIGTQALDVVRANKDKFKVELFNSKLNELFWGSTVTETNLLDDISFKFNEKYINKEFTYVLIETKNKCKETTLLGRPHVFDSCIINFNDSETTDSNKLIEIWESSEFQIIKKRDFILQADMFFVEVRINHQSKALLLKDNRGRFWKILL